MSEQKIPAARVAAAYVQGGWIYSSLPEQNARFWISDGWVWGPLGAADPTTGYWIDDNWIWGPLGAQDFSTGFQIQEGFIYGPRMTLPFAR